MKPVPSPTSEELDSQELNVLGAPEVAGGGRTATGRRLGDDSNHAGPRGRLRERRRRRHRPGRLSLHAAPCPVRAEDDATDILEAANQVQLNDRREQAPKVLVSACGRSTLFLLSHAAALPAHRSTPSSACCWVDESMIQLLPQVDADFFNRFDDDADESDMRPAQA